MFYWVVKAVLAPILRLLFRPWAEGAEYVPRTGPAVLASNHLSFSDHFFAPLPLPRKVVFLAKSEYFTGRGIKGLFSKAFFSGVGQIPVDRSGGEASERALATGLRVLASGQLLGIYPEGTRTPDGRLFRGKTGVARLALEARVPVIPCAMIGGFEFQPPGRITPRFKIRPGVRFGKPLDFSRYYGMQNDKLVLRAVTDEVIYEIMRLSGQEYVDEYAAQHKAKKHAVKRAHKHDAAKGGAAKDGAAKDAVATDTPDAGSDDAGSDDAAKDAPDAASDDGAKDGAGTEAPPAEAPATGSPAEAPASRTAGAMSGPAPMNGAAMTAGERPDAGVAGEGASGSSTDAPLTSTDAEEVGSNSDETTTAAKAGDAAPAS
jgi:1-acyl-sn-glycerol-3-phosphate acyltransferase